MSGWFLIEMQCDDCGADVVLHGPFESEQEANETPRRWPTMICTKERVVQAEPPPRCPHGHLVDNEPGGCRRDICGWR